MFSKIAAAAALVVAFAAPVNAQHITRDTDKARIIALLEPHVETFDKVLAHPIGVHYRQMCDDWREGTVRPPMCSDRRGNLVRRSLVGEMTCKKYVELLRPGTNLLVWANLTDGDIDFNNKWVDMCILTGGDVKPLLSEQL
jgi:hypothetical protein